MIGFLTSSADIYGRNRLNPANGFVSELKKALPHPCSAVWVCSDPYDFASTDLYGMQMFGFLSDAGISISDYSIVDSRNADDAASLISGAQLVILSGGHVPTQNRFFRRIDLRGILSGFSNVLMSISAGTMNCADTVYSIPELPGEAVDPDYERFLPGLGLTDINVIPHFQYIRTVDLDGQNMSDIALGDSHGRKFYALNDGSYILLRDGKQELRGEAFLIENGLLTPICRDGQAIFI